MENVKENGPAGTPVGGQPGSGPAECAYEPQSQLWPSSMSRETFFTQTFLTF